MHCSSTLERVAYHSLEGSQKQKKWQLRLPHVDTIMSRRSASNYSSYSPIHGIHITYWFYHRKVSHMKQRLSTKYEGCPYFPNCNSHAQNLFRLCVPLVHAVISICWVLKTSNRTSLYSIAQSEKCCAFCWNQLIRRCLMIYIRSPRTVI